MGNESDHALTALTEARMARDSSEMIPPSVGDENEKLFEALENNDMESDDDYSPNTSSYSNGKILYFYEDFPTF